jgi:hypothetical protein
MSGDNQIENVMRDCTEAFHKQDRTVPRPRMAMTREQVIESVRQRGRSIIAKNKKKS